MTGLSVRRSDAVVVTPSPSASLPGICRDVLLSPDRGVDLARCGEHRLVSAAASQGKGHVAHRLERTGHSAQLGVCYLVRTTHDPSRTKIVRGVDTCACCACTMCMHMYMSLNPISSQRQSLTDLFYLLDLYGHSLNHRLCATPRRAPHRAERAASLSLQVRRDVAAEKSLCGPQRALYLHARLPLHGVQAVRVLGQLDEPLKLCAERGHVKAHARASS